MMDDSMKEKDRIREELTGLLDAYYNGSFSQMVCDSIRFMGMTQQEVVELLEAMKKEVDAS